MKFLLRLLASIAAPFVLIFGGAGLAGVGVERDLEWLAWAGLILIGTGVLWVLFWYLAHGD